LTSAFVASCKVNCTLLDTKVTEPDVTAPSARDSARYWTPLQSFHSSLNLKGPTNKPSSHLSIYFLPLRVDIHYPHSFLVPFLPSASFKPTPSSPLHTSPRQTVTSCSSFSLNLNCLLQSVLTSKYFSQKCAFR